MIIETPPKYEDSHESTSTQRELSSSSNRIHRRPIAVQRIGFTNGNAQREQSTNVEKRPLGREPSMTGGSEYSDPDTNGGVATPSVQSCYDNLPLEEVRCSLLPHHSAAWSVRETDLKLGTLAATVLLKDRILKSSDLELFNSYQRHSSDAESLEPTDPISGVLSAVHGTIVGVIQGLADYPVEVSRMMKEDKLVAKGMAAEFATDKGKGVAGIVGTGLRAPLDYTMGLSKGFHNLPKAYGDETVRKTERVTGFHSGLKGAGKGFGYGLYDGISGVFVQPVKGAQKGGALGFMTGLAKGLGGVVCKPAAGVCGLPAYAFKGIYEELNKKRGFNVDKHMETAFITQGQEEWEVTLPEDRNEVIRRWYEIHESPSGKYE